MRKLFVVLAVVVVAVVILGVLGATMLDVNRFRPRIQADLQEKLGRPVTLGELHLHLFPFSIKADGLSVAESPSFASSQPFANAQEVFASADLMSIIHGSPHVNEITLSQPHIELIRNAAGVWNFSTLGSTAASSSSNASKGGDLTLKQLKITGGQVAVTDMKTRSARSVYNNIDITLSNFAPNQPFDLDAAIHFPGQGKELVSFTGKAGPLGKAAQATPIDGQLSIEEVAIKSLNNISGGSIPANTDGVATGRMTITSQGGTINAKGTLSLTNAVIQGKQVDAPIETQYDLKVEQNTNQISIAPSTVKVGPTAVQLSGTMDSGTTPSKLNVKLSTANASITELSHLAALFGASSNKEVKGTVSADLNVSGTTKEPIVQGTIAATNVQAQQIVLSTLKSNIGMSNGVLTLNPLSASLFGGSAAGAVTLDTKPVRAQCAVKVHVAGVDTNALLSAVSTAKDTLYGQLTADADLGFAIADSANLAKTLNGTVNFNVANGKLANVNVLNELSKVGRFLNAAPAQQSGNSTPLQKLAGTLVIHDGVATTNNLAAGLPQGSLAAVGTMNLVDQGLNLHVNAVLSNGISKAVGGNGVGGYLNTALANKSGELVLPVIVTGTMAHPTFQPDVQAIAKMKLSSLLPTTGDPAKMVQGAAGGLLGGLLGGGGPNQNSKNPQKKSNNPLGDLLKGLQKK